GDRVADAEAAADVDHRRRPAELLPALRGKAAKPVDRKPRRAQLEQLRAEVHVQPGSLDPCVAKARDRLERLLRRQAELRAVMGGADRRVRVDVDPGCYAHERLADARCARPRDLLSASTT